LILGQGFDVWHCHEASFLLENGAPIAGTLKFVYSSDSPFMVESKSMKLYLNSFDMCKMGYSIESAKKNYVEQITRDLSEFVGVEVSAYFFDSVEWNDVVYTAYEPTFDCNDIASLYEPNMFESLVITDYSAQKDHLYLTDRNFMQGVDGCYYTNVLRSRCHRTKQKDTGSAIIWHDGAGKTIDPISFFQQVVSLRELDEFHESCAEQLFSACKKLISGDDRLTIGLMYSRRGSLDINPIRTTDMDSIPADLIDARQLTRKLQGQ
jgi:7-cyano-7-deazaguanine reductase